MRENEDHAVPGIGADRGADATDLPEADGSGSDERPVAEQPRTGRSGPQGRRKPVALRSQLLMALMCVLLGFGIVVQVRQTQGDEFAALRQDDLVRLLDEVTQRNEDLTAEREQLLRDRSALRSGSDTQRLAEEYQVVHGVLAGTQPVEGPGVVVTVRGAHEVSAQTMVHMLEELRNAGAEAVEVSGQRLVASSAFADSEEGVLADGRALGEKMEWRAIGDPQTISVALNIPGGALAGFRNVGAVAEIEQRDLVQITAIREVEAPSYAVPVETED